VFHSGECITTENWVSFQRLQITEIKAAMTEDHKQIIRVITF